MKCNHCHLAVPVIQHRDKVPYDYRGHTTSIEGVNQMVCLRCGCKSIPPGYVSRWLEQTALFRAHIDALELAHRQQPGSPDG